MSMANEGLSLTERQVQGVEMARWLSNRFEDKPLVGVLAGYAGTGKTTTLRAISKAVGGLVILTPTGKAALRVAEATGLEASTIRRWMYSPIENEETGETTFVRRVAEDIYRPSSGLIAIDEASMVDEEVWRGLLDLCFELRCNVLCIGDAFQLPPVRDTNFSILAPDFPCDARVVLTEVMRQALDSPIIRASMLVREGRLQEAVALLPTVGPEGFYSVADDVLGSRGVLLCHKNATRHTLNTQLRERKGYDDTIRPGEPILVLRNSYEASLYNGEVVEFGGFSKVTGGPSGGEMEVTDKYKKTTVKTRFGLASLGGGRAVVAHRDIHGQMDGISYRTLEFYGQRAARKMKAYKTRQTAHGTKVVLPPVVTANFGYALTCHKAQGSEWDKVLVYAERSARLETVEGLRWFYTAITRAKREVSLYFG